MKTIRKKRTIRESTIRERDHQQEDEDHQRETSKSSEGEEDHQRETKAIRGKRDVIDEDHQSARRGPREIGTIIEMRPSSAEM